MGSEDSTAPADSSDASAPITLEVLRVIKTAQQQHGLRHGDYQRYRGYCSRRVRRLRKALKLPQGDRRHFKRRDVTEAHIQDRKCDERYLEIPLMLAERCWAYGMQLKQESNTERRKKFHLVQKLRKACVYALQLEELVKSERCDARTKLEAQAYVAWIQGGLQFELQMWMPATENLQKAQVIYEKIASTLTDLEQAVYAQRVSEIAPSLRYCAYNIGEDKAVDLLELRSQGILDDFEALVTQTKQKSEAVLHEVTWFGVKIPITIEQVRLFLVSIEKLDESLEHAETPQDQIKILENLFTDLRDVVDLARDVKDPLLLSYLLSIRVERTSQRYLILIQQSRKPQDCVRLLDIVLQQTTELSQNDTVKTNELAQEHFSRQLNVYKILRVYYLAKSQVALKRYREAAALYESVDKLPALDIETLAFPQLRDLYTNVKENVAVEKVTAQANCVLDSQEDSGAINIPQKVYKSKKPLIERLDEFREEPQLLTKNPNIVNVPPNMEPVPAKPLFYDLALNFVEFPDLTDKLEGGQANKQKGAGISDFVKGLWGWGKK